MATTPTTLISILFILKFTKCHKVISVRFNDSKILFFLIDYGVYVETPITGKFEKNVDLRFIGRGHQPHPSL
jgi:hypothetical protein